MGSASYSDFQVPDTPGMPREPPRWPGQPRSGVPDALHSASAQRESNRAELLRRRDLPKIGGRFQLSSFRLRARRAACISGRTPSATFSSMAWPAMWTAALLRRIEADASYALATKTRSAAGSRCWTKAVRRCHRDRASRGPTMAATGVTSTSRTTMSPHAFFAGVYFQDEWKIVPQVTLNFGARMDYYYASFDNENQLSPRANIIYTPTDDHVPRRLRALFHPAAAGEGAVRRHVGSSPAPRTRPPRSRTTGEGGARELFRRRDEPAARQPACRSAWTATTKRPEPAR